MLKKFLAITLALNVLNLKANQENISLSDFFEKTNEGYRFKETHLLEEMYMESIIQKAGAIMMLREIKQHLDYMEKIEKKHFELAQRLGLCD